MPPLPHTVISFRLGHWLPVARTAAEGGFSATGGRTGDASIMRAKVSRIASGRDGCTRMRCQGFARVRVSAQALRARGDAYAYATSTPERSARTCQSLDKLRESKAPSEPSAQLRNFEDAKFHNMRKQLGANKHTSARACVCAPGEPRCCARNKRAYAP